MRFIVENQGNIRESKWKEVEQSPKSSFNEGLLCFLGSKNANLLISFLLKLHESSSLWSSISCLSVYRADFTAFTWSFITALKSAPSLHNLPCFVSMYYFYIPRGKNIVISAYVIYTVQV